MEALNGLFRQADLNGMFSPLRAPSIKFRLSLYVNDLVIFLVLEKKDIRLARAILEFFASAFGLHTNLSKCQFSPIKCIDDHIARVTHWFPCQLVRFPCRYLGIPLLIYKLKKGDLIPLVDAVADRLPVWKSKFKSKVGRIMLTKVTLTTIPIHVSIAVEVSPWIYKEINKI
jgi:hypothetical protein